MEIVIREEMAGDWRAVGEVVAKAFAKAEHSDGNEAELVEALRRSASFVPRLSLVACCGDAIVGHILFTKITIGTAPALALAPLAVLPQYQRKGVGKALIAKGHSVARELGFAVSVVLGDPEYYKRFGYEPAKRSGIVAPFDVEDKYFMACALSAAALPSGLVAYDPAFGI